LPRPGASPGRNRSDERRDSSGSREPSRRPRSSDEEAFALRDAGHSYNAVARSLGFKRGVHAQAAFIRALRKREGEERQRLSAREAARLDELETRIRTRDASDPERMSRRLTALAKLRGALQE